MFTPVNVSAVKFVFSGKRTAQAHARAIIAEKEAEIPYINRIIGLVKENNALKREIRRLKKQARG